MFGPANHHEGTEIKSVRAIVFAENIASLSS
jgi:hypothetical protein